MPNPQQGPPTSSSRAAELRNLRAAAQQQIGGHTTFELLVKLLRTTDRPAEVGAAGQSRAYSVDAAGRICVTEVSTVDGQRKVREYQITPDSGTLEEWRALTDDLTELTRTLSERIPGAVELQRAVLGD